MATREQKNRNGTATPRKPKLVLPVTIHLGTVESRKFRPGLRWSVYVNRDTAALTCTCPKRTGCSHIQQLMASDANARMRVERVRYAVSNGAK